MTLEEIARKEKPYVHYPEELDLFCYCVNAEVGHTKEYFTDNGVVMYRCTACKKLNPYDNIRGEQDEFIIKNNW